MRKSKRNFILIFGFILIINSLFFPCDKIEYSIEFYGWYGSTQVKARRWDTGYSKVFFPLIKSRANKYKEYVKWESSALLKIKEEIKPLENELFKTPLNTYTEKELYTKARYSNSGDLYKKELNTAYTIKNEEFKEKFGHSPCYNKIIIELFFIEPVLLFLIGGTILVGVRKIPAALRKTREKGVNRIKRRKTGVVLSLIGVGVLAGFLPWSISAGDESVITLLSIAGITLFLVGIGMVIFSFFPDDVNPKKKD